MPLHPRRIVRRCAAAAVVQGGAGCQQIARWQLSRMASSQRESPSEATAWFDQCAFVSAAVSLRDGYAFLVRSEASIGSFPGPQVHSDETAVVFQEFLDDGLFHRRGEPVARILAQGKSLGVA